MRSKKISETLHFLKTVTSATNKKFADKYLEKFPDEKDITRNYSIYLSGKYDDWSDNKDKRKELTLKRIAKTHNTSSEQIKFNPYFTKIIKVRMAIEGVKKISIDSEVLEFCDNFENNEYALEEIERNENIRFILEEYKKLNFLDCYKLIIFYNDYKKINTDSWNLVYDYAYLNEKGKIELRNHIYSLNTYNNINLDIKCLDKNKVQLLSEIYKKTHLKDEKKIHEKLNRVFEDKLNNEVGYYLDELKERIIELPTLDLIDWMLIEAYYSLNYYDQQNVIKKCTELIENPQYSTVTELFN